MSGAAITVITVERPVLDRTVLLPDTPRTIATASAQQALEYGLAGNLIT